MRTSYGVGLGPVVPVRFGEDDSYSTLPILSLTMLYRTETVAAGELRERHAGHIPPSTRLELAVCPWG